MPEGRHHPGTAAAEAGLQPLTDRSCDPVFLDLGVPVVDDAQGPLLRLLEGGEERVEETDVVVRKIETGRVFPEETPVLVALGVKHRLPALSDDFFRRRPGFFFGGGKDFGESRETQPPNPFFGKQGAQQREGGNHAEQKEGYPGSFHRSFQ